MENDNTLDDIVRGVYTGILGRQVDRVGLRDSVAMLRRVGVKRGVPSLARSLINSDDYQKRLSSNYSNSRLKIKANNELGFAHSFSIGDHCLTANLMRNAGLRRSAGPFDWIFSSADVVEHCLSDNFKAFLDRSYYEAREASRSASEDVACDHRYYRDQFGIESMFNHRNPQHEDSYGYLVRCVERLRAALTAEDGILLVSMTRDAPDFHDKVEALRAALSSASRRHLLLVLRLQEESHDSFLSLQKIIDEPDCHAFNYSTTAKVGPLSFSSALDDAIIEALLRGYGSEPQSQG